MSEITVRAQHRCHGGQLGFYSHESRETGTTRRFGLFLPPAASLPPALYYLAGLECTEETFLIKSGATRLAAELGLALVAPDTSPRGADIAGEEADWDLGTGAGFYVDATAEPWRRHYRMQSYVARELPALIERHFPVRPDRRGIFGHSMGGHGALVVALLEPERWHSLSAFAPIANPVAVPWGIKAFGAYFGDHPPLWRANDASLLMTGRRYPGRILVDQGLADRFIDSQLRPQALEDAARASGQDLTMRRQEGYDHSYWFIQSFIADHLQWHARDLL